MKNVISVSLGSRAGDFARIQTFDGVEVALSRVGVDGDMEEALLRIQEFDGKVDAIGLGGIDIYLRVGNEQLVIGDGMKLKLSASKTPVVDGSGLKNTLERNVVQHLFEKGLVTECSSVLMVSALDRFGMAEALFSHGCKCVFGDIIFNIGLDFPLDKLSEIEDIAKKYRTRLLTVPFHLLYPTGSSQNAKKADVRYAKYYMDADIIAGDAHLILRHMPERIDGKGILTNTTRPHTLKRFADAGASWVMRTTPDLTGVSGGTNIMEAVLIALMEKPVDDVKAEDYLFWIKRLGWNGSYIDLKT